VKNQIGFDRLIDQRLFARPKRRQNLARAGLVISPRKAAALLP
jgi:hypothetical protein